MEVMFEERSTPSHSLIGEEPSDCATSAPPGQRIRVTEILHRYLDDYLARYRGQLPLYVLNTLLKLIECGTPLLGGHVWQCASCHHEHRSYNGCRNRACPNCGHAERQSWLARVVSWMLPVDYYQAVFTCPHTLCPLILANERLLYRVQFDATREALLRLARDPVHGQGAMIGLVMVLHTWGQLLMHHPHIHVVLPGGGFCRVTGKWLTFKGGRFFLDSVRLATLYRDIYVGKVKRLYRNARLEFPAKLAHLANDPQAFTDWIDAIGRRVWIVHCGRPQDHFRPHAAFCYLSRYVQGSALTNARILSDENGQITFRYKDYTDGKQTKITTISGVEFVRRFALHLLPPRFVRIRYGGFLEHSRRNHALARARETLGVPAMDQTDDEDPPEDGDSHADPADNTEVASLIVDTPTESGERNDAPYPSMDQPLPTTDEPPAGENDPSISVVPDNEADTTTRCPHCGQAQLRWKALLPASYGWRKWRAMPPRRARERQQREFETFAATPQPLSRPPPPGAAA